MILSKMSKSFFSSPYALKASDISAQGNGPWGSFNYFSQGVALG
jgi:hypothetical protein